MHGPNRKNFGTPDNEAQPIQSGAPQNQNGLASARILGLLNQIGDKLVKGEQERIGVQVSLEELQNRADMSERIFLTIQDKISKNETVESEIVKRQENLERMYAESAERLERAEALSAKIEEAIALQNRLARRLEKTAQDKARILSKIERIEIGVEKTREALNSKALIQLAEQAAAGNWLPQAMPANDRLKADAAAGAWWKRPYKTHASTFASLLMAGMLGGLAMSQLINHWPQTQNSIPVAGVEQKAEATVPAADSVTQPVAKTSTAENDMAPYGDEDAMQTAMDNNADQVAENLNKIEPGTATPADTASKPEAVPVKAAPLVAALSPAALKAVAAADKAAAVKDDFDADAFIRAQLDRNAPLADRMKPDPALPAVVRQVEDKAFKGVPEAQHDLAAIYTAGHAGVAVDYQRAAFWFGEAAANGVANARYNLGVLYHQGLGVEKNVDKAIGWYHAAAQLNHPEAEYNLGIAEIEGIGTKYDPQKAAKYFEQAARGGVLEAAYNLGLIYENGLLGDPDMNEAIYWYKLASDYSPEAKAALTQAMRKLNLTDTDVNRIAKEYNAIYKIPSAKPAASAKASQATQPPADDAAVIAKSIPPLTKEESQSLLGSVHKDQAMIAQVQEQLIRLKLYSGPADGLGGPTTEDAIRSYQSKNNLPVTGKPSEDLLVRMLASDINAAASNVSQN